MNKKGFSLTEVLVTLALLAIVSSIATMGYGSYVNTAEKRAVRTALNKLNNSFIACMSFSKNKVSECNTLDKVGYKPNKEQVAIMEQQNGNANNICLLIGKPKPNDPDAPIRGKEDLRACIQYENGQMIRKCFEKETPPRKEGYAGCNDGICCKKCLKVPPAGSKPPCEFGTGAES